MNYTIFHLHSDLSILDSVTKSEEYIKLAKQNNMTAIGESNHGNVFHWIDRKVKTEEAGLKYIHAQEFYLTNSLTEKIRDNYHIVLISRNWEGVKELNKLSSIAYHKDGHFYYNPRISIDELMNTSDNILITTACLASPLYKGRNSPIYDKYLEFIINNKHRCWLEIQPHLVEQQKEYNQHLYELHLKYSIPMIVGTDTHASNKEHLLARKTLMQAKNIQFNDEDEFDLSFKTYNEIVEMFKEQNILPKKTYLTALENTNIMANMIEEFTIDMSYKYPKLYKEPEKIFQQKINDGLKKRGPQDEDRIKYEYETYKKLNAIDYMLLMENITSWANQQGIYQGPGRGSVTGSLISYILGITDMNSIKYNLNFERFMNPERISLGDIDVDWPPNSRNKIIEYVANLPQIDFSEIITFNTIADKGSIRDAGRALKIPLKEVDEIAKNIEFNEQDYREKYPELFTYVDIFKGTNVSVGSHPSGFLCSPMPIDENFGYFYTSKSKYPVSQINMKEIEYINGVKLDILGLDNIEIINETCKLAGIERLTPDNVNTEDDKVWDDIAEDGLSIFQFESDFAHDMLSQALKSYPKMKKMNPNIDRISLTSMVNGAIRPSGESFRDKLVNGELNDNGHEALNTFLSNTQGFLIYQEQIIDFLHKFCGFTKGEADNVRRKIGKKLGTEDVIPEIKERFIKTMHEQYNVPNEKLEQIVEPFLQIILNASSYGFSLNHSQSYSFIGYMTGWLRYYYPLEFITTLLNINKDNIDKTSQVIKYANKKGIKIKPIQFRKSTSEYSFDKNTNTIYKSVASIKHLNIRVAEELYSLKDNQYNTFIDLLIELSSLSINSRQTKILISLNYFREFGKNKKLLSAYSYFKSLYNRKTIKKNQLKNLSIPENIIKLYAKETEKTYKLFDSVKLLNHLCSKIPNQSLPLEIQLKQEYENFGYCQTIIPLTQYKILFPLEINTKYTPKIIFYNISTGKEETYKIYKNIYKSKYFEPFDLIRVIKTKARPRSRVAGYNDDGTPIFEQLEEMENYIMKYVIMSEKERRQFNDYITKKEWL